MLSGSTLWTGSVRMGRVINILSRVWVGCEVPWQRLTEIHYLQHFESNITNRYRQSPLPQYLSKVHSRLHSSCTVSLNPNTWNTSLQLHIKIYSENSIFFLTSDFCDNWHSTRSRYQGSTGYLSAGQVSLRPRYWSVWLRSYITLQQAIAVPQYLWFVDLRFNSNIWLDIILWRDYESMRGDILKCWDVSLEFN